MRNAQLLGLQQQRGFERVIDGVGHALQMRELLQAKGRLAVLREHAHRRGIEDNLGIRMAGEVLIVVFSRAGDGENLPGAQIFGRGMGGFGGAPAAQNEHFFAGKADARALYGIFQPGIIRIVAKEPAAAVDDGIDGSDAPGGR